MTRASCTIHCQISLMIAGILGAMCTSAEAKTLTVPDDYPTIQQAVDVAGAGDIIEVAPGIYPEEIILKNSGVTIRAQNPNDRPKIDGGNRSRRRGFFAPRERKLSDIASVLTPGSDPS